MDCISVSPSANHVKIDVHRVDASSLTDHAFIICTQCSDVLLTNFLSLHTGLMLQIMHSFPARNYTAKEI